MRERLIKYVEFVEGSNQCGQLEKHAVQRFKKDLLRKDIYFDEADVKKAVRFIETIRHFRDEHNNTPFILEPWQVFIVANIVGWKRKESDRRRFTESYIELPRKNGKTALGAALALFFLIADGVNGAEVDFAANSKDQADIAFNMVKGFAKKLDPKNKLLKPLTKQIKFDLTDSVINVFAADDSTLDGYNASFALVDEYHAAKNSKVKDVIKSSMAARRNPHLCTITTAGFDKFGVCYKLRTVATEILTEIKTGDSFFALIFSLDEGDDYKNPYNFRKIHPNLGVTVYKEFLFEEIEKATNEPDAEPGIRTKTFNEWMDTTETWIPAKYILDATSKEKRIEFPEDETIFVGVDLASTSDLTAVTYMYYDEGNDHYTYRTDYYLPESKLKEGPRKELYNSWKRAGLLTVTSGNVTDYDYITHDLLKAQEINHIQLVAYDRYNATQWAIKATDEGLWLEEYSQSIGNFNKPTKALQRQLLKGQCTIENNEITRYCFRNVAIKRDHNGNEKPNKDEEGGKIDGVISMIQSLGGYFQYNDK